MLKKVLLLATAAFMAVALTACGGRANMAELVLPEEGTAAAGSKAEDTSEDYKDIDYKEYENNLDGLCKYMEDSYIVSGEPIEMSYDVIGAQGGVKYSFTYRSKPVQVELYSFDLDSISEKTKQNLENIKNGKPFKVLETQVTAVSSDSGEYIMIYSDNSTDDENEQQKNRAEELLEGFYSAE